MVSFVRCGLDAAVSGLSVVTLILTKLSTRAFSLNAEISASLALPSGTFPSSRLGFKFNFLAGLIFGLNSF